MKRILVHSGKGEAAAAVLENGKLTEFYEEFSDAGQLAGNVYLGRVVRVLQGMQAAFVDIGLEKNVFLYIDDLLPAHLEKRPKEKPPIHQLIQMGETVMVQVVKEPTGNKGARVTTHYSIPGRFGVYMPQAGYVAVSRKIESNSDRERLKRSAERFLHENEGYIVRTAALGEDESALEADLTELRKRWSLVAAEADRNGPVPRKIYSDLDLLPRLARDLFREDVEQLIVNEQEAYQSIVRYLEAGSPGWLERVKLDEGAPLFKQYDIRKQLELSLRRKVWLDNGAYLIIDHTEALTVFDVNTGKYTGTVGLESTAFDTNLAAAREIARLLRLRDIGGLIVVDFIDMESEQAREQVLAEIVRETRKDRTKTVVVGWTRLGLVELTRKKVRESKDGPGLLQTCKACGGSGWVLEDEKQAARK